MTTIHKSDKVEILHARTRAEAIVIIVFCGVARLRRFSELFRQSTKYLKMNGTCTFNT